MADEVEQQVEESLNMVVITMEQSSNMKKALKQKIFETVSTLRTLFVKLKDKDTRKTKEINNLKKQVGETGTEIKQCRERLVEEYRATSMDRTRTRAIYGRNKRKRRREDQVSQRYIYRPGYRTNWEVNTARGATYQQ